MKQDVSTDAEARDGAVVLGIGVNVNQARAQLPERAGSLRTATGEEWDRDAILDAILDALGTRYEQWREGGLDAVYDGLGRVNRRATAAIVGSPGPGGGPRWSDDRTRRPGVP